MEELIGLRLPTPVGVGCQRRIDLGRMVKVAIPQPGFRSAIRAASRGDWLRFLLQKKRMGWDLNPRTTFAVAGFQDRCIQPLCHPSKRLPFANGPEQASFEPADAPAENAV